MGEISRRALGPFLELIARRGLRLEDLVEGTSLPLETLRDPPDSIPLESWIDLLERVEAVGGPGFVERLAAEIHTVSWSLLLKAVGRFCWTEEQFWKLMVRRWAPRLYPALEVRCESLPDGRFVLVGSLPSSSRGSRVAMQYVQGLVRSTPRLLGIDADASFEAQLSPHHLRLVVTPIRTDGPLRRAARRLLGAVLGEPAVALIDRTESRLRGSHEQLRASQERLQVITENGFDLIAEIDPAGTFHYASPNFRGVLGLEPEQVLGRDAFASVHPDERADLRARLAEAVAGDSSGHAVLRFRHADGTWRWLDTTAKAFEPPHGGVRVAVVARDVSEQRRAAAELEGRNRSLATLHAVADALYRSLDFAGTAQRITQAVADHTEFPAVMLYTVSGDGRTLERAASSGLGAATAMLPASEPVDGGIGERAIRDRRVTWFGVDDEPHPEARRRMRELGLGTSVIVPLLFNERAVGLLGLGAPFRFEPSPEQGETLLALGKTAAAALESARHVARIEREVAERNQAESALREGEERLREVTENVEGIFYLAEAEAGRLLYLGPSFERITGLERQAVMERPVSFLESVHPDDRRRVASAFAHNARGYEIEYRVVRPDGSQRILLDRAYPVRGAQGPPRVAGFAQDVTELRELELQLRHSQKMEAVGRLAGGIAHDFNNLLTVVSGYGEVLRDGLDGDDPRRATAEEILCATERASGLTRQLLTLSRKQPLEVGPLDLNEVIRELATLLRTLVGEDVVLDLDLAPDLGGRHIAGDRGQLEQVLVNLAVNARDAMPDGGRLGLETRRIDADGRPARVRLAVRDTGTGMDAETQARVFEPFFSTKDPGHGTGLGLATVYSIVEQAGGRIEIESAPGKGSCFVIDLPLAAQPPPQGVPRPAAPAPGGSETLLLVEDQQSVRSVAGRILRERGYRVIEAADGAEALERVASVPIDLLVTDVVMPGMRGTDLADRVAESEPQLPILFVSGYSGIDEETLAQERPGVGFLAKPFSPSQLAEAVREVLDGPQP